MENDQQRDIELSLTLSALRLEMTQRQIEQSKLAIAKSLELMDRPVSSSSEHPSSRPR